MNQPRHAYIAQRAHQEGFPYYLRLPNDANAEDGYLEVKVQSKSNFESFKHLVEQISLDDQDGNGDDVPTQDTESLRKVLSIRY